MTAADDRDRADIRPGEDLYDRIDRLVDEDPIALRDLAWRLLAERDTNAIEHNAARAEVAAAEARGVERGYRRAVERLRVLRTVRGPVRWYEVGTAQHHADYLEAVEGDDHA